MTTIAATPNITYVQGSQSSSNSSADNRSYWGAIKDRFGALVSETEHAQGSLTQTAPTASRFDLRAFAESRMARLIAAGNYEFTAASRGRVSTVLNEMIVADGPTPQVGATPDNSLEIHWLVNGVFAGVIVESDGYVSLTAEVGDRELDAEFDPDDDLGTDQTFRSVCDLIAGMGASVSRRPGDWPVGASKT